MSRSVSSLVFKNAQHVHHILSAASVCVYVALCLPLSELDAAQHTMRTRDDITAAHLRVAPSFLRLKQVKPLCLI